MDSFQWLLFIPFSQYWFLYTLLLVSLIYYFLRFQGVAITVLFGLALVFLFSGPVLYLGFWPPLNLVRSFLVFYTLGAFLQSASFSNRLHSSHWANLLITSLGGYLVVSLMVAWNVENKGWIGLLVAFSGILGTCCLGVLLERLMVFNWVRIMGLYSLEIYLTHTIFGSGIRIILSKLLHVNNLTIHLAAGLTASIIIPLAFTLFCNRLGLNFLFRIPSFKSILEKKANQFASGSRFED